MKLTSFSGCPKYMGSGLWGKLFFNNCITQQLQACSIICLKTAQCKDSLDEQAKLSWKILTRQKM